MDRSFLADHRAQYHAALHQRCLPYWLTHGCDDERGGFFAPLYADGHRNQKSGWNQGRGLWVFSRYYRLHGGDARYLAAATRARDFFLRHGFDERGDGLSLLAADGCRLAGPSSVYTDIYWIHGLAEHALASGDSDSLDAAGYSLQRVRQRIVAPEFEHSLTVYTRPHQVLAVWFLLLDALLDLPPDVESAALVDLCCERLLLNHLDISSGLFVELLAPDGTRFADAQGREVMPGHTAQACRVLLRLARQRGDDTLSARANGLLNSHLHAGWDPEYGGIFYLIDLADGHPVDADKNTWQQIEFLVALLAAYENTGASWAAEWYKLLYKWASEHHTDPLTGLWHTSADRSGEPPAEPMPLDLYHYPRMLMLNLECCERLLAI